MEQRVVELKTTAQEFKMNLLLPGYVEDNLVAHGSWEPYLISELSARMGNGGVFLDVGANIGYHSLYIASSTPAAVCISFEPHPKIFDQFVNNINSTFAA